MDYERLLALIRGQNRTQIVENPGSLQLSGCTTAIMRGHGEKKPFTGSCHNGQLDLFYYRDPGLKAGKSFPLWTIM